MKRIIMGVCALALAACTTTPVDICQGADLRRTGYTTAITVADAAIASGHGSTAVMLGREAAVTALSILNANCPPAP